MTARAWRLFALAGLWLTAIPLGLAAAELPKATQKILQETKLPEAILSGLDKELMMPDAWLQGAKKEKLLRKGMVLPDPRDVAAKTRGWFHKP